MTTTMNTPPPPTHDQLIDGLKSQIAALKAALDKALAENVELRRKITPTQAIGKLYGATPDHGGQP